MWLFPDASCTSFVFLGFISRDRCVIEHSLYKRMVGKNLKAFCRICAVCAEVVYWIGWHFFKQHSLTRTTLLLTMRHSVCSPPLCPSCHFSQIQASTSPCAKVPKSQLPTCLPREPSKCSALRLPTQQALASASFRQSHKIHPKPRPFKRQQR